MVRKTLPWGWGGEVQGRAIRFNSEYNKDKWGFIAKEQGWGSRDGKLLRANTGVRRVLARLTHQGPC